MVEEAGNQI